MNKLVIVVFIMVLLTGCASVQPQVDPYHVAWIGTAVADTATTAYAIDQGLVETNLLYGGTPSSAVLIGAKVGGWFILRWVDSQIPAGTSPWLRTLLWVPSIALQSYSTIHNVKISQSVVTYKEEGQ